jgi:hypothetical protein
MFAQHSKEHLLKAKWISIHVVDPTRKTAIEDKIAPLNSKKNKM